MLRSGFYVNLRLVKAMLRIENTYELDALPVIRLSMDPAKLLPV